jgi:hypothetical protein
MPSEDSKCESNRQSNDVTPYSVIEHIIDHFGITHGIEKIFEKTSFKPTDQMINAIVFFIFFLVLYFEPLLLIITLIVLFIFIIIEFVVANIPFFSKIFSSEEKTDYFIKNIGSYQISEVDRNIRLLKFSPKNINSLLDYMLLNRENTHFYIIDDILLYNPLSTENLDKLFSPEILNLRPRRELIIDLLMKYNNQLSSRNIENISTSFSDDEDLIKILIATQIDFQALLSKKPSFKEGFDKYQKNEKSRSVITALIHRTQANVILYRIALFFVFLLIIWGGLLYFVGTSLASNPNVLSGFVFFSFFISFGIGAILGKVIGNAICYWWIDRAKKQLLNLLQ